MKRLREGRWRLLTLLVVLTGGCDLPGKPREADRPVPADQVKDFDALYGAHCAGCHGADGKLGPAPPLNDPVFLAIVPDAELRHVITEGRAVTAAQSSAMPAFARAGGGPLTDAQVQVLAEGIKKRWGPAASGEATPPYLEPGRHQEREPGRGGPRVRPRLRRLSRQPGTGRRARRAAGRRHQRTGVPGADQRPGAAPHRDHRPARSRDAGLRRHGRPAGRFPSADLGADRRPGGALASWRQGGAGRQP